MRRVVILLVVIGIAYAAVLGLGASRQTPVGPPQAQGEDKAPQPGFVQLLGRLTAPFAPRLDFQPKTLSVPPNAPFRWVIPSSDAPVRVARFTLEAGPLAAFKVCPRTSITPCDVAAVCAVPQGQTFPAVNICNTDDPPGPAVKVAVRNEDGTLWIIAPNGPVSLRAE